MSNLQPLDEEGFKFTDLRGQKYWVRMWSGEPWLCYLHVDGVEWVTLRKLSQMEVWRFNEHAEHNHIQEEVGER